jgi:hypothetical protein
MALSSKTATKIGQSLITKSNDWEQNRGHNLLNGTNSGLCMAFTTTLVKLTEKVMARIDKLKGQLGEGRSDMIRAIVIASPSEKGYLRWDESER